MWRLASLKLSTSNLVAGKIYISLSGVWSGVNLSPTPRLQAVPGKWTPGVFLQILPSYRRGQKAAVLRTPCPEGKAYLSGGMGWVATICTWLMRGGWLREPRQLPRGPGSLGPARQARNQRFWLFPPILYHYYCRFLKIQ